MANSLKQVVSGYFNDYLRGHQQHHATPERKERRRIVKLAGRRQAIKHFKDMRVIAKLNEVKHG